MSIIVKVLVPRKQVEAAQTMQYTATNCKAIIDKATVTNTSAANVLFSANMVASTGAAGDSNLVIKTRAIAPQETYLCPELVGQVLESAGFLSTLASVATSLTLSVSGREIT